jgi:hypothetical protein
MYFGCDAAAGCPVLRELLGWMVRDADPATARKAWDEFRHLPQDYETDGVAIGCAA